jgi:hypothetical protein
MYPKLYTKEVEDVEDIETVILCTGDIKLLMERGEMLATIRGTDEWIRIRFVDVEDLGAVNAVRG